MDDTVFVLQHTYEVGECGHDEVKFVGVYKSRSDAEDAMSALKGLPGFRDHQNGFSLNEIKLNQTGWQEGFVSAFPDGTFSE